MTLDTDLKKWMFDTITALIDLDVNVDDPNSPITWERTMKLYNKGISPDNAAKALIQISEEFKLSNISSRVVSDTEMIDFIKKVKQDYVSSGGKSGGGKSFWKGKAKTGDFDPADKSRRREPFMHSGTARKIDKTSKVYKGAKMGKNDVDITWEDTGKEYDAIVSATGEEFDLDELRKMLTTRPSQILGNNEKMNKTGENVDVYSIGLPALTGLVVDEDTGEFTVINTCPSAGACKVQCYAMKGNYIRYSGTNEKESKLLNWLLNDPNGFANKVKSEVKSKLSKAKSGGRRLAIRWHDAGDFFSPDYADLAVQIAKDMPDVTWYAYTKVGDVASRDFPSNFTINFSLESKDAKNMDLKDKKFSTIVKPEIFKDHVEPYKDVSYKGGKPEINKKTGQPKTVTKYKYKSEKDLEELKYKLATAYYKYDIKPEDIITYEQMKKLPEGDTFKYHVIILPSTDGDDSAFRRDVQISFLLFH